MATDKRIVVLDGYTSNPGDLSWAALEALGEVVVYERSASDQVVERLTGARIALTNKAPIREPHLAALPELAYIGVLATGYDVVDVAAARRLGVTVTNVPAYSTASVAQFTFGLILELAHRIGHHHITVHTGRWSASPDWSYWDYPSRELDGLVLGVVGYGRIGSRVAGIGQSFGMKILTYSPGLLSDAPNGVSVLRDLDALFEHSDVVSLHCPLTPETAGMVDARRLSRMKPSAYLINASRGPLVDQHALAEALRDRWIAGAALDVLSQEPPQANHPLFGVPNCILTPHMAWASAEARARLLHGATENLRLFLAGAPTNVVS